MTDRELLELAAKAAKYDYQIQKEVDPYSRTYEDNFYLRNHSIARTRDYEIYWNPLTNDGDAFRLAVKVGMRDYFGIEIQKGCTQATSFEPWEHCEYEEHNNDPYAATRRAIVRAVAEIGKGEP